MSELDKVVITVMCDVESILVYQLWYHQLNTKQRQRICKIVADKWNKEQGAG